MNNPFFGSFGTKNESLCNLELHSLVPINVINALNNNQLPVFVTKTLMLQKNETCHYIDKVYFCKKVERRKSRRRHNGFSIRIMKGLTYHVGDNVSTPEEEFDIQYIKGNFYITDQRIVFTSREDSFEYKLNKITSISIEGNYLYFQIGNKIVDFIAVNPELFRKVILLIKNS